MKKIVKSYTLSEEVIKAIHKKASDDDRADSTWLNLYLTKQLGLKAKSQTTKDEI